MRHSVVVLQTVGKHHNHSLVYVVGDIPKKKKKKRDYKWCKRLHKFTGKNRSHNL